MTHNLTETQIKVLKGLVELNKSGKHDDEFMIHWSNDGTSIIGVPKDKIPLGISRGVLEVLEAEGYITLSPMNFGVRVGLRGSAEREVMTNFKIRGIQPNEGRLRKFLASQFGIEELRNLCQDIGLDYENISGTDKNAFAREMVSHASHRDLLWVLVEKAFSLD